MGEAFNVWVRFAGFQGRSFLIPYPHIIETKPAAAFMVESFGEFKQFLEKVVKKPITDEGIEGRFRFIITPEGSLNGFGSFSGVKTRLSRGRKSRP